MLVLDSVFWGLAVSGNTLAKLGGDTQHAYISFPFFLRFTPFPQNAEDFFYLYRGRAIKFNSFQEGNGFHYSSRNGIK